MPADVTRADDPAVDPLLLLDWVVFDRLAIPGRAESVQVARQFTARTLGCHSRADDAVLLISELVTNAVLHTRSGLPGGMVFLAISGIGARLLITTADDGCDSGMPRISSRPDGGNGLVLVESIADQWGYRSNPSGTTVWFTLGAARARN